MTSHEQVGDAPVLRSNRVQMESKAITSFRYIDNSLKISKGQPSAPPPTIEHPKDTGAWVSVLQAGRHGTNEIANWFVDHCGGRAHVFSPDTPNTDRPAELNFYYGVSVGLRLGARSYSCELYFAQGHYSNTNNWWIGGPNVLRAPGGAALLVLASDADERFTLDAFEITGGVFWFYLTPITAGSAPELIED